MLRCATVALISIGVTVAGSGAALAHPLGNFTTNAALRVTVLPTGIRGLYVVDLAEIPALKVRQSLNAATSEVPPDVANRWSVLECTKRAEGISLLVDSAPARFVLASSSATFSPGQAGLYTARLTCELSSPNFAAGTKSFEVNDTNFADRLGWRETTAVAEGGAGIDTTLPGVSPSALLTNYPANGATAGMNVRGGVIRLLTGAAAKSAGLAPIAENDKRASRTVGTFDRGNSGITKRFQDLVAQHNLSPLFTLGALFLATVLGGFHAMAPGHGKSMMAAYVLSRRGGRRELLTIGGTVALTHTIGVLLLGALFLAGNSVSAGKTLQWTEVASGVLVIGVGAGLLRDRMRAYRSGTTGTSSFLRKRGLSATGTNDHAHPHPHAAHDHAGHDHAGHDHVHPHPHAADDHAADDHAALDHAGHDHVHPHPHAALDHAALDHAALDHAAHDHAAHDHGHPHPHPTGESTRPRSRVRFTRMFHGRRARLDQARLDPNLVVTSHAHGGLAHTHVLPAPGAMVSRRQLLSMGLAGGLVPSPSALVVLLGAVALGRAWFGVLLVVAYGIGLALTLMGAGMLLAFFESRLRTWTTKSGRGALVIGPAVAILPVFSAFVLVGAGTLLVARALSM